MSSSDYTNLRRLRHVYYPSLNNYHQPHTHQPDPCVNSPYVSQPHHYGHPHHNGHHPNHSQCANHLTNQNLTHDSHNYYHCKPHCDDTDASGCHTHHTHTKHEYHDHHTIAPTPGHGNAGVNSSPSSIVNYPPQPPAATPIIIQAPTPAPAPAPYPFPYGYPPHPYAMPHPHEHDPCLDPYGYPQSHTSDKSTLNITKREYYLLPTFYGSVTVSIDSCQDFRKNMQVLCISDLSSNTYFEGTVYSYDKPSGEITIHQIKNINGDFSKPSKYLITLYAASQQVDALKERIEALYLKVFGIDIGGPDVPDNIGSGGTSDQVEVEDVAIKNLYTYFFNETIANEANYEKSITYLNNKINNLYIYFFNKDLTTETSFNPNGNNIVLDNLTDRVEQLNLYFFGDKGITINV